MDAVDLALVLAVDGSASVTFEEFGLIAGGMAAAIRDPSVVVGLTSGPAGASACCLLLWSGAAAQDVLVAWTRIASPADADAFAGQIDATPRTVRAGLTAIGEALLAAASLLDGLQATAGRRIINVIGDGRSNDGRPPAPIRDRLAASGVTINGLCVLHEEPDLVESYTAEVIGGPGGFALACADYPAFTEAMTLKLTTEIAAAPRDGPDAASTRPDEPHHCPSSPAILAANARA
jgi:Ca-activated chloride channel homolog